METNDQIGKDAFRDVRLKHAALLDALPEPRRPDSLCELNRTEQVVNVCQSTVVQEAWERRQQLSVVGWIYSLKDGLLRDFNISVDIPGERSETFRVSVV